MDTLTINLKSKLAYEKIIELEEMNLIHIADTSTSHVLSGEAMEIEEFNQWLSKSEEGTKLTLSEFKQRWNKKKNEILK
jgi:hypothetical protein